MRQAKATCQDVAPAAGGGVLENDEFRPPIGSFLV